MAILPSVGVVLDSPLYGTYHLIDMIVIIIGLVIFDVIMTSLVQILSIRVGQSR